MYGYTLHFSAPVDTYRKMHKAVLEVIEEDGGAEGLLLHFAHPTDRGFDLTEIWESKEYLDAFNRTVIPKAMSRADLPVAGPEPELSEFTPVVVMTPRAYDSDTVN